MQDGTLLSNFGFKDRRRMTGKLLKLEAKGLTSSSECLLQVILTEGSFHDVTLACGDHGLLGAHKVVLAARSRLFRRIFKDPTVQQPFMTFPDTSMAELTFAVQFLYLGRVEVDMAEAGGFLQLLKYLEVEGITQQEEQKEETNNPEEVQPQIEKVEQEGNELMRKDGDVEEEDNERYSELHSSEMNTYKASFEFDEEEVFEGKQAMFKECGMCDYKAKSNSDWLEHVKTVHKHRLSVLRKKVKICNLCDYQTRNARSLVSHKIAKHNIGPRYQCDKCEKSYSVKQSWRDHVKYVHEGIEPPPKKEPETFHPCKDCDFVGETTYFLLQHIRNVHPRVSCDICGFRGLLQSDIKRHKEEEHEGVVHSCPHCAGTFKQKQLLNTHMKAQHGPQDFLCSQCDYTTGLLGRLGDHVKKAHSAGYKCDVCGHIARQKHGLKNHKNSIHGNLKYHCDSEGCEAEYTLKENLKNHRISKHEGISYPCSVDGCDYRGSKKVFVTKHKRLVHEGVRYCCTECGHRAGRPEHLKVHLRKHFTEGELENVPMARFRVVPQ